MNKYWYAALLTFGIACASPVMAQTKADLQRKQNALKRELAQLNETLSVVRSNKKKSLTEIYLIDKKIKTRQDLMQTIHSQIGDLNQNIRLSAIKIQHFNKQLDTLKHNYANSIVQAYKNRNNYNYLNFIFSSSSFNDAIKRISYLKSYQNYRESQVANIKELQGQIQSELNRFNANRREKNSALGVQKSQLTALNSDKIEKDSSLANLQSREGEISQQISEKNKIRRQLASQLNAIIQREIAEARAKEEAERQARIAQQKAAAAERERQIAAAREAARQKAEAEAKARLEHLAQLKKQEEENNRKLAAAKSAAEKAAAEARQKELQEQAEEAARRKAEADATAAKQREAAAAAEKALAAKQAQSQDNESSSRVHSVLENSSEGLNQSLDFEKNKGRLPWPVSGSVVSKFGTHSVPGSRLTENNIGIDIATSVGASVHAVAYGEVIRVADLEGTYMVVIRHGQYFTAFSNLSSVSVAAGNKVRPGTVIGRAAASLDGGGGSVTFVVNKSNTNLNPESWLSPR